MAGYSGTPLAKKLGIKPGSLFCALKAPSDFEDNLAELPEGVSITTRLGAHADVVVYFTASRSELERRFAALAKAIAPAGSLWIGWPKKSSGVASDLDENIIRTIGLGGGLVDVKVCAIDDTWSGLKFVVRVADRGPKLQRSKSVARSSHS
ncbi:MAG TPA: hypothetical protein VIV60_01425 [Polyangiaceae bacterium]